ncbi:MAG: hypothetical protein GY757_03990, partial [bacterium]|nr:hypothetical protein [bacterium]
TTPVIEEIEGETPVELVEPAPEKVAEQPETPEETPAPQFADTPAPESVPEYDEPPVAAEPVPPIETVEPTTPVIEEIEGETPVELVEPTPEVVAEQPETTVESPAPQFADAPESVPEYDETPVAAEPVQPTDTVEFTTPVIENVEAVPADLIEPGQEVVVEIQDAPIETPVPHYETTTTPEYNETPELVDSTQTVEMEIPEPTDPVIEDIGEETLVELVEPTVEDVNVEMPPPPAWSPPITEEPGAVQPAPVELLEPVVEQPGIGVPETNVQLNQQPIEKTEDSTGEKIEEKIEEKDEEKDEIKDEDNKDQDEKEEIQKVTKGFDRPVSEVIKEIRSTKIEPKPEITVEKPVEDTIPAEPKKEAPYDPYNPYKSY